ncbi:DUF1593-domain-containing protein [Hypoxylon sp. FL1857]|nr:DUF1593-domain-containing protein [Hypoxylon sp. FL1857]
MRPPTAVLLVFSLCNTSRYSRKPRLFVLTDLGNEPDDQMSLIRLLTYSNEIDIKGVAAVTSTWLKNTTNANTTRTIIRAYGRVVNSLNAHNELLDTVTSGHPVYGLAALQLNISDAATRLIKEADSASPTDPLYVTVWGGANVLAESLNRVSDTRNSTEVDSFTAKLRAYAISDQDDAGTWIRQRYPKLFYVVSLSGFSGPDTSLVTNDWLERNIRIGQLGAHYPNFTYIMEGDTPSFLPLIRNGLGDAEHPEWGSWGGRYSLVDDSARSLVYSTVADAATGVNNATYVSAQASIWRWRQAYQNDFANRMYWTLSDTYEDSNHHPVVIINGAYGPDVMTVSSTAGEPVILNASESWDPDNDELSFQWLTYKEVSLAPVGQSYEFVTIETIDEKAAVVRVTPILDYWDFHLILVVTDNRELGLTTYRRVILKATSGNAISK